MSNRIDKYREDFLDYLERERNYSPHTINSYRTDLLQFCQFIQHLQVDSKILIKTSKTLSEGSLSDMKIIKLFVYKVLAYTKEEIIKSELQIDFSKNDSWRIFKDDDWMVKQDKVICLLLYSTIISPAQIIDLDLNHLQLNQNKINISGKQKKRQTITFCKKTQKAINGLIQHRKNHFKKNNFDEPLFLSRKGGRISQEALHTRIKEFFIYSAEDSGFTLKFLRELFATHLFENGVHNIEIEHLLGNNTRFFVSKDGNLNELYQLLKKPKSISPRSRSRKLSSVRSFLKFLLKKGILENNPASIIKSPKYKVDPPKVLEQTIMKVLLTPIESEDWEISRDRTILEVFYSTGIRLSELTQINLGDINFIDNEIIIFGKGRKERMVFFGQEVSDAIKLYLSDHEIHLSNYYKRKEYALRPLFVTKKGIRIKQREVQERIKIFFDFVASNLSKTNNKRNSDLSILINSINPTPHLIRHTFATHLINAGVKMEIVKDLLGHEKLSTTQIYTHLDVKGMKKILDNAHPHA